MIWVVFQWKIEWDIILALSKNRYIIAKVYQFYSRSGFLIRIIYWMITL